MDLTLIFTIIGVFLTALVPLAGYIYKTRKDYKNYYSIVWKSSGKINAREFLGERPYEEYYYERNIDNFLARAVERRRNALVVGPPLSGKTRAVFNALKKMKKGINILVPRCVEMPVFQLPVDYGFWKDKLIFIDDMQYFIEKQDNYYMLFRKAKEKNIPVIATVHSGKEFKKVKNKLIEQNMDLDTIFGDDIIELERISANEGKSIAQKLGMKWDKVKFNGTIGSIFMRLSEMEKRYDQCDNIEKTILSSIRNLYVCGIYDDNNVFKIEWIKKVSGRYELEGKDFEWTGWLKNLEDKEFIKIARRHKIWAEDAYLEYIVKPEDEMSNKDVFEELVEVFKGESAVLLMLGERAYDVGTVEVDIADYMRISISAFGEAISCINRDADKHSYIKAQSYQGQAHWSLSKIENTLENSKKSITIYNEILKALSADENPLEYAKIMNRIGNTFTSFAEIENKAENCIKAIDAYLQALEFFTLEKEPQEYARVHNNLGGAYLILAEVSEPLLNYKKAGESFKESLKIRTIIDNPKLYAVTKNNLANAYSRLSEFEDVEGNLEMAIQSYEDVIKISTKEKYPLHYALVLNNIGNAYSMLAGVKGKKQNSKKAIEAFEKALEIRTVDKTPVQFGNTMFNLGDAYFVLSEEENTLENIDKAILFFEESMKIRTLENYPFQYAETCYNLGKAFIKLAEIEDRSENYQKGIDFFNEALKVYTVDSSPFMFERTMNQITNAKKIFFT